MNETDDNNSTLMTEELMREWIRKQMEGRKKIGRIETITIDGEQEDYGTGWQWETISRNFGICYVTIGVLAIVVNIVIMACIIMRRRTTFSHVFYIIILNFTIIDTIKGISSILFALKLLTSNMAIDASTWTVRVDQYSGVLLRFTNLTTILNVLLITMNEFVFICFPLRYTMIVTRFRVLCAIVTSWTLALFLTILNMFANVRHRSVMIDTDCDDGDLIGIPFCIRHQETSISHYFAFHLALIAFCLVCLAITSGCYLYLFRIVVRFANADAKYQAEIDLLKEDSSHTKTIVRRRKYVIMIGCVILVYTVYLTTYAVIQGMHLFNISRRSISPVHNTGIIFTKYICYLFLSFHSLLQPLCFMRMREFRNILKRTLFGWKKRETILSTEVFKRQSCQPTDI